jgi:hypothetical protein
MELQSIAFELAAGIEVYSCVWKWSRYWERRDPSISPTSLKMLKLPALYTTLFVLVDAQSHQSNDEMIGQKIQSTVVKIAQARITIRFTKPPPQP